jgi:membrane protease YdiL (CAAX protease family)
MPVITARLSIDTDSIIDAGFMRLVTQLIALYNGWSRLLKFGGAIGSSLVAGLMAFFAGVIVPTTLWERFAGPHQAPSADVPVTAFGLVLGVILGLITIYFTARWLWPTKEDQELSQD